ncbi:unnamed protein product, partial [Mesorhabditis belari]|uniref:Tubulin polyglutamylase TTLL4 n=1 Tax=Mesorhabditis belari TaxID=2138241 RepID=A0AAF3EAX3_9BILA
MSISDGEGNFGDFAITAQDDASSTLSSEETPTEESENVTSPGGSIKQGDGIGMCGLTEMVAQCLSGNGKKNNENQTASSSQTDPQPFLRSSFFTHIPPTVRFYTKGTRVSRPNRKLCNRLQWCHNSLLPIVMRNSLAASHFKVVDESLQWIGYWGRHLKSVQYKTLKPIQKVNHFPGAFHIGRKDRLWLHLKAMQKTWGDEFKVMPYTYVLPKDAKELRDYLESDPNHHVIVKPPASARGTGISVTRNLKEIPTKTALVAQHYVARPMTINGAKFDLRLYAYVTSLDPLRLYLYEEGLVRFASVPYSSCLSTISNRYMHLTNYSINKLAEADGVAEGAVPKWRLSELWTYLDANGWDVTQIQAMIDDTIIKAVIACEKSVREHMTRFIDCGFVCHELFGIDILLDEDARPWLLEVNISPSLHSGTPLDIAVKAPLAKDVLNMAGIQVPADDGGSFSSFCEKPRYWQQDKKTMSKERHFAGKYKREGRIGNSITKRLTPEDVRILCEFEDEYARKGDFRLLFPSSTTVELQQYFPEVLYSNLLLQQWQILQDDDRQIGIDRLEDYCRDGYLTKFLEESTIQQEDV